MPIKTLRKAVRVDYYTLRLELEKCGIPLRRRGRYARNHKQFSLTQELFNEICRDGIRAVATRLGMSYVWLRHCLVKDSPVPVWSRKLEEQQKSP